MSPLQRLPKILSESGAASRRQTENLIREGRVTVNGQAARLGDKADPLHDHIKVDGRRIFPSSGKIYILLNKPKGTVTTVEDPEGRTTVLDLLKDRKSRLFPVGRLDYDAEGFLLLTNDGELAHCLSHPSFRIPRTYQVKVKGKPSFEEIARLSRGIILEDGRTAPSHIKGLRETEDNAWLEMVLYEGRNRQVKRMWGKLGYPVLKLKRVAFAGLTLGSLMPGEYRSLQPTEVQKLKAGVKNKNIGKRLSDRRGNRNRETNSLSPEALYGEHQEKT
jgi:23S rRNA pseudouridine2605 synthase